MALRDQPYLPLYVQDYLTDEKLSCCSLSSQGVYIRILCVLHKSATYGGILFKQIPKQNFSSIQYFAFIISKQIGCTLQEVADALEELLFFEVLKIRKVDSIDYLFQKRMEKDFDVSLKRSNSAKKGGGNPKLKNNLFKQNSKQTPKQIPEYEYESENEYEIENKIIKKEKIDFEKIFENFNIICNELPQVKEFSESRKKAITARIKSNGVENLYQVFKLTAESDFLTGKKTDFKASFDWILSPKNFIKILEGNYKNTDNNGNREKQRGNNTPKSDFEHKQDAVNAVNAMFGIK